MIDWDFETRLVDRIAAREAIAARLTPRQKQVLCSFARNDETLKETAQREGVTGARICQIVGKSIRLLRDRFEQADEPRRTTRSEPPPHFDRAAFLRHMQMLIRLRETEAQEVYRRERQELDDLLEREAPPKPPPKPSYTQPSYTPPPRVNVEPWFDRSQLPTLQHLQQVALYAVNYLVSARGRPFKPGMTESGTAAAQIICARDADAIAAAMMRLVRETIPPAAYLSSIPLDVPDDEMLGVTIATAHAALRVVSLFEGMSVAIDVTWDENA